MRDGWRQLPHQLPQQRETAEVTGTCSTHRHSRMYSLRTCPPLSTMISHYLSTLIVTVTWCSSVMQCHRLLALSTISRCLLPLPYKLLPPLIERYLLSKCDIMQDCCRTASASDFMDMNDRCVCFGHRRQPATGGQVTGAVGQSITVAYYWCGEPVPYRSNLSLTGAPVTLAHVKQVIAKKGNLRCVWLLHMYCLFNLMVD